MSEPATDQIPPCLECGSEYTHESGSSIIRLLADPVDGPDIDAKVPGAGQMYLKSSVVKKL